MGAVNFSLDLDLVKKLKSVLPLNIFVETGTFEGDTIESVKDLFSEIHSVELSEEYFRFCKDRFKDNNAINLYLDNSPIFLEKLQLSISKKSVLYWLDAHWCVADKTVGEKSQCPLLEELKAIKSLNDKSIIIIDDARLFIAPPPFPHEISQWPDFESVIKTLKTLSQKHNLMILNDTIIFYPLSLKETMHNYAYNNSINWLTVLDKSRDYDSLLVQLKEKEKVIDSIKEKEEKIKTLSLDLKEKEVKIISLSKSLKDKEKQIVFLSESLNILKKRLSTPIWGLITLFQHHFPRVWNFIYEKKKKIEFQKVEKKKKHSLSFFSPRLGRLFHHLPITHKIPQKYFSEKLETVPLKISVVTPSFNQGAFIKKTIESVIEQNYCNLEYIIYDSCSEDGTQDVLKNISQRKIKCFVEKDKGQADGINKGFMKSSGEIMAWINSDDIYLPGTFNYVVNYFNTHPEVDVVYGHRVLIDSDDNEIGRWVLPRHDKKVLYWADFIPQETLFWRRSIWEKIGCTLTEEFNFALDWDLLLRFQETGAKIIRLPRFLASFRVHPLQKTTAQISSLGENEMSRVRKKYLGRDVEYSEVRKKIFTFLVKSELLNKLYQVKLLRY